jgi:hypothetical protein
MPTTNAKVAIELYVDDQGTLRMKEFSAKSQEEFRKVEQTGSGAAEKLKASWESVKGAWLGIVAGIMAMREAWDLVNLAAKADEQKRSFASLAASYGASADQIIADLKRVSGGTVDTMTLVKNAGTAMMMGIAPDNVVQLMKIAGATAKMTGQSTVKAFEDITLAVGRQSKMILDNLGIILDVDKANEEYATSLGKTAVQLTDVERKQAFMVATMKAGGELMDKLGRQTDTASERLARFATTATDVKMVVGDLLLRAFNLVESVIYRAGSATWYLLGAFSPLVMVAGALTDALHITSGAAEDWAQKTKFAMDTANEMSGKANLAWKDMISTNDLATAAQKKYAVQVAGTTEAMQEQEKSRQKILDKHKSEAEKKAAAEKEMYEEAGFGAEKYFTEEANELVRKSIRWKEAGANIYEVEQWLYNQIGELSADAYEKGELAAGLAMDAMQDRSRTLADEFTEKTLQIESQLAAVGVTVENLDGQTIGLRASFDGSSVVTGIDGLIDKFEKLRMAASSAPSTSTASSSPEQGSFQNSDTSLSASQVAAAEASYYNSNVTVNVNQQVSRSDVNAIVNEQKRLEDRS